MREILFRGKRTNDGRWIEGYYMHHINRMASPIGDGIKPEDEDHIILYDGFADWNMPRDIVYTHVDPESIGQYTGLTDKNGKRIFEGDIVRWASANTYLTSNYVYDRKAYGYGSVLIVTSLASGFTLRQIKDNAPDIPNANRKIDNYSFWNHQGQLEVIGNIHDNPELIGGKEE